MSTTEVLDAVAVAMGPGVVSADMDRGRLLRLPVSGRVGGTVGPWSEALHLDDVPDAAALTKAVAVVRAFEIDGTIRWVQSDREVSTDVRARADDAGMVVATRPVLRLGNLDDAAEAIHGAAPADVRRMTTPQDGAAFDVLLRWVDLDVDAAVWRARGERQRVAAGAGSGHVWVARTPAMPVGVVGRWWSGSTQVVAPLVVHQAWRRKGVAAALLATAWHPDALLFSDGRGWAADLAVRLGATVIGHLAEVRPVPDATVAKA